MSSNLYLAKKASKTMTPIEQVLRKAYIVQISGSVQDVANKMAHYQMSEGHNDWTKGEFSSIYIAYIGLKLLSETRPITQTVLDETVIDLVMGTEDPVYEYDFSEITEPMWIDPPKTNFVSKGGENTPLQGVLIVPVESIVMPTVFGGMFNDEILMPFEYSDGLVLLVIADNVPVFSINLPKKCENFGEILGGYVADSPEILMDLKEHISDVEQNGEDITLQMEWDAESLNVKDHLILVFLVIGALVRIFRGEFLQSSTLTPSRIKDGKVKVKRRGKKIIRSGGKMIKSTTYVHVEAPVAEPRATREGSNSTSEQPFMYTPRNVSSHFKRRWVTLDYADQLDNDDIIDIQPMTKDLKQGAVTKDWALVKIWHEFTHKPELDPKYKINKYKA